jgi:hypothetical protein
MLVTRTACGAQPAASGIIFDMQRPRLVRDRAVDLLRVVTCACTRLRRAV